MGQVVSRGHERRQFTRYDMPLGVEVDYESAGGSCRERSTVANISIGGALLRLREKPEIGGEMVLTVLDDAGFLASALGTSTHSTDPIRFRLQAKVVRRDQEPGAFHAVGVEFVSPLRILRSVA
jgi:c-di-GMP-binding flagellar brake protein YcgR